MPFDARKIALDILNTLDRGHRTLDNIMEETVAGEAIALKRDRAFIQTLVYGVLRWRGRLDLVIGHFSNTRFEKIDPRVLNILRLALFQMIYLDRVPISAAVNTAVELAKKSAAPWVVGFVNALLRRAAREHQNLILPAGDSNPITATAGAKSFPEWIVSRWIERYGLEATATLCDAINAIPPITVRTNRLKASSQDLLKSLAGEAAQASPTLYAPDGITLVNPAVSIPELGGFKAGWFQVQDEAAQLVSLLLNPQPGETVLDACAGLGGKTGHIAQLMKNTGSILALDMQREKLLRLETEMTRLGVAIVKTFCCDLAQPIANQSFGLFDRILLDAPCSGLGVMRRNPDIKWRSSSEKLSNFREKQLALLYNLSPLVKSAGVLVYAVCSPEPEETVEVVNEFLKNDPKFVIDRHLEGLPDKLRSLHAEDGWFKVYPDYSQMDGFSFVRLKKIQ